VTVLKMPAFQISLTYSLGGSAIKVLAILDTLSLAVERGKDGSIVANNAGVLRFQLSIPIMSPQNLGHQGLDLTMKPCLLTSESS
jgi:hypothetical protein